MYGIFTYIYHKDQQHVGKYNIHGSHVIRKLFIPTINFSGDMLVFHGGSSTVSFVLNMLHMLTTDLGVFQYVTNLT